MRWQRINRQCEKSEPPGFLVTGYRTIRDGQLVWVYQAIRLGTPSIVLLQADTAQACKAACR